MRLVRGKCRILAYRQLSRGDFTERERELTQPRQLTPEFGLFGVDPKPDCARGIPRVDVDAIGYACKVRLEGAGVVCTWVYRDFDGRTGGDG